MWKKTLVFLGLLEDEEEFEEELADEQSLQPASQASPVRRISRDESRDAVVRPLPSAQGLGQVHLVEPRSYEDAKEIGDKLKSSIPVIMNLQQADEDLVRKLTAFVSGLAYGVSGGVQKLVPRVYLITPANVEVSAEDRRRLAERGLFNEF